MNIQKYVEENAHFLKWKRNRDTYIKQKGQQGLGVGSKNNSGKSSDKK